MYAFYLGQEDMLYFSRGCFKFADFKMKQKLFTHQSTLESIISFQEEFELGGLETLCHFSCMDCIH